MKLHRLELEGFGPFRERQTVDFDAFAEDGLFLISGRTGAGKSSVLDGVCYALYGGVPRYEGAGRRLRSDHSTPDDPSEVRLEFTAEGKRWRVTRSPEYERPKRRGGGTTTEPHRAVLERLENDQWVGVAARPVDVAAQLDEILGLTQQQFLQVILLAQNRFARFLLAKNDERQALLRTLFATKTYEQYAEELESRRKDAERMLSAEGESVRVLVEEGERLVADGGFGAGAASDTASADEGTGSVSDRIAALARAVERAEYRVDTLMRERSEADAAHRAAVDAERAALALHRAHEERRAARASLAEREQEAPRFAEARAELALAEAAEALRGSVEAAERAEAAEAAARGAEETARERWLARGEQAVTAEARALRDEELSAVIAACDQAAGPEAELERLRAECDAGRALLAELESSLAELEIRREPLPAERSRLDAELAALAGASAALDVARASLEGLVVRREAAREALALAEAVREAERRAVSSGEAMQQAGATLTRLLRQRLAGAAADLAADLADGEACPVCGAVDHPHPAPPAGDTVTDAQLLVAEREKDAAIAADHAASEALQSAREALAIVAARAGGEDLATLEEAHEAATRHVAECESAVRAVTELSARREQIDELLETAESEHRRLLEHLARAREKMVVDNERLAAAERLVNEARDGFPTIAARRADALERRAALRSLVEAAAEASFRAQMRADAVVDRDVRLAGSSFADSEAVRAALRPVEERDRLDASIREHEASVRSLTQRLLELELELVDVPDGPVDLETPAAAVAATRETFTAAVAAHAEAAAAVERLRDIAQRADDAAQGIAELSERHAVIARLAHTVAGRAPNTHRMTLETFVLAAELEEIVAAANLRLAEMSSGRYRLLHSDALAARGAASGLGLEVLDAFTGQARPPQSLSGGESFLASLALALGLAEVVTARAGGLRLDTLFIDEGFGSLDDETLDLAMRTLDELRQGGRTVGVISHVAAMKDQVPAQLLVQSTPEGPSIIRQGASLPV